MLDRLARNERAQRILRGEPVEPESQPLPRRLALDFGDEFGAPTVLLCPACGQKELVLRSSAQVEGAAAVFCLCSCGERFAVEFVAHEGMVVVGAYEPTPLASSRHGDD